MGNELLASKIVILEEQPRIRSIPALPTAVLAVVGLTEKGPVGEATLCTSFEDYYRIFGGDYATADCVHQVRAFFQGGGQFLYVVRTCHYTDVALPASYTAVKAALSLKDTATPTPADTLKIWGKYCGAYANDITVKVETATSGDTTEFNLTVLRGGVVAEIWPNLTMVDAGARYAETVINDVNTGSALITAEDKDSVGPLSGRPASGTFGPLTAGDDGLTSLADTDYVGSAVGKTGLYALDLVTDATILIVPGRTTAVVQTAMWQYCEVTRARAIFPIFDPPAGSSAAQIITWFQTTAAILGTTEMGACYWPRVKVMNPSTTIYGLGTTLTVAPSGHIAGMYARNDTSRLGGIWQSPAGIENGRLTGVVGLETTEVLDETKRDVVFPKRINPITQLPGGGGYYADGARGPKASGNFLFVASRRGASYVEQSVKQGLQFVRHQNHTEKLRQVCHRTVYSFMLTQMRQEAFASMDPNTAFFVDFGEGLNPPSVVAAGQLRGRVGMATNVPAEFVVISFSLDTRAYEEELLAAQR